MLNPMMLQPRETEAKALMGHEVGTYEEWLAARLELLEREKELTHD
jgi:predicted dithiol-disulfide oxidoreductase (DUF899 family)